MDSLPASGCKSSQITVIDAKMMDSGGAKMGHPSGCRTASPSGKQLFTRIQDANLFWGDVGITDQTSGNV